ncbi:MAG: DNA mismatch repair endonuclease MutL [FCB group bacterium]|jgi:DNA mismatch repair protein MutL|nr:DNA mismatch repair endonuclease MutL [FCB group bacterium]
MSTRTNIPSVRILPEEVANKIAAGEVVERPASVVKELVENAIDAQATRITVRIVAAGRRTIEVLDNGHGMTEQDAVLCLERHATSKIRKASDLDNITTLGFRGEALASIAAVSRLEMVTRRERDDSATRVRIDGGVLRDVSKVPGAVGTRITVNRLYFNTPARAKFLKGMTTELSQCIDIVQRHALCHPGIGFQIFHNDKLLLDVPENATLRERVALIWGLGFLRDMVEIDAERNGVHIQGLIGSPVLSRSHRSHQFFFLNGRPVVNRSLQYGFEDGYSELLTIGRHPVGMVLLDLSPLAADVNVHPTKREIRFRDERTIRDIVRDLVRERLAELRAVAAPPPPVTRPMTFAPASAPPAPFPRTEERPQAQEQPRFEFTPQSLPLEEPQGIPALDPLAPVQTEFHEVTPPEREEGAEQVAPGPVYRPIGHVDDAPMQLFDTYLLVPQDDRLLIIDQHALHERLTYDRLLSDLEDNEYQSQQLAVPLLVDIPPSHARLLERNLDVFQKIGLTVEPFGGNTFQVTSVCHLYEEARVPDVIYRVLDELAQGDLFDRADLMTDLFRLAVTACRGSVKAGDRLMPEERRRLLEGFRRLRPPYTCPHGRPIITELTQLQMEKSFRRRQ